MGPIAVPYKYGLGAAVLAEISGHIASMAELREIIGAMGSLAGMRVQESQRALPGVRRYAQSVEEAIGAAATLALTQPRQPPLHNLGAARLLERLMAEYVFALLTEAVVESIGSENAARLAAMEAAHDSVEKKLGELHLAAREARQGEITAELLDLIAGAEALTPQ
jgi:F0F1-type ATP synthase gamma subunit